MPQRSGRSQTRRQLDPDRPWRVFLSHTSDLREHPADRSFVDAAEAAVIRAGHAVTDMAYFAARDSEPADHCLRIVEGADVYVGIIGSRYGAVVRGQTDMSYTELEFEAATTLGMPRLLFLISDDVVGIPTVVQSEDHRTRQQTFRARLLGGITTARVATPADLEIGLHQSLVELRAELQAPSAAPGGRRRPTRRLVRPRRPTGAPSRDGLSRLVLFWLRMHQPELGDAIALLRRTFKLTRPQLIDRMCELAGDAELGVDQSLLFRWEVGEKNRPRVQPGEGYLILLGRICEVEVEKLDPIARREFLQQLVAVVTPAVPLGLPGHGGERWRLQALALAAAQPGQMSRRMGLTADDLGQLTNHYEHLRRRVAGSHLLGPVRAHVDFANRSLRDSSLTAGVRPPLISAMGEAAVLAGRLSFWDLHDEAAARMYFERAGDAASESGDRALGAYALAFTAELSTYVKQPGQALTLSRTAQELAAGSTSPRVQSWLAAVEAEAAAHVNDVDGCVRALARAREAMARTGADDQNPQWIEFFDHARLAGYAGASLVRIGHEEALPVLQYAAAQTDPALRRYQAEIAADLAWALAQQGEIEESCRLLEGAFDSAREVDYRDGMRRVLHVRRELDALGRPRALGALDERLLGWAD